MTSRQLLSVSETKCNDSDTSSQCLDAHAVGLSLKALSLGIIFIVSMTMNGTICLVFYKKTQLLSVSNTFVLNLICCQLALCIVVLPFTLISVFSTNWIFNDAWCHIEGFILTVCIVSTQFSLTIIAVDRNYAIINSLRYPYVFTQKRGHVVIGVSWAISVVIGIPPLAGFGTHKYYADQNTCLISWEYSKQYSICFLTVGFLIPLLIQSWCYLTIFKAAMNHTQRNNRIYPSLSTTTRDPPSNSSDCSDLSSSGTRVSYKSMECKAMRTILLIACTYAVCWVPYLVCAVNEVLGNNVSYTLNSVAIVMVYFSTSVDPFIYAFMNRIMRFEIYKFYCDSLNKISGRTSTFNDSEDYMSSTNVSTSHSTSRHSGSRNSSIKSRHGKSNVPGRAIEMNTIQEENEPVDIMRENVAKHSKHREIILSPVELHTASLPINIETKVEVHNLPSIKGSTKTRQKPMRSRSEIWSSRDRFIISERESFLFFNVDKNARNDTNGDKSTSPRSKSKKRGQEIPLETVYEHTTLTSSTAIHNAEHGLHNVDIITELSIDVRRKGKATRKQQLLECDSRDPSGSRDQTRKCLSA